MKIIVFGGSGFIGSHVADILTESGHEVRIFDLEPSPYFKANQEMITGDILDEQKVNKAVEDCDYIYHFAGIADLDDARTKSLETVTQNIKGTAVLLGAARRIRAKRFVFASTVYVYSDRGGFYRCSKQAAELYVEEYQRHYGLDYTILRYGSVYGPRADHRNSVYKYLKQAMEEGKIEICANGEEMREYIHVRDAARLSVEALSEKHRNQHIIITGHHPMKFRDFLYTIKEILGNKVKIEFKEVIPNSPHYNLTPYSFIPKIGYKLTANHYLDMGQGLLECIDEIHSFNQIKEAVKNA
ncbi:MAG: NAD(P)-dependent oxidoreductase [Candidatus Omnitrophota bacterium]|nr:MAG: NAD(P)-dependent oxidoreductase [Candidatus Omnitrophota bacterium]